MCGLMSVDVLNLDSNKFSVSMPSFYFWFDSSNLEIAISNFEGANFSGFVPPTSMDFMLSELLL